MDPGIPAMTGRKTSGGEAGIDEDEMEWGRGGEAVAMSRWIDGTANRLTDDPIHCPTYCPIYRRAV